MQVRRFNEWIIDEMIYLDITSRQPTLLDRQDTAFSSLGDKEALIRKIGEECMVPLTWGGQLRTFSDAASVIALGADKVIFTSALVQNPDAIARTAARFGSQAVCVGVDFRREGRSSSLFINGGSELVAGSLLSEVQRAIDLGAGEVLIHAIDRDGVGCGYDLDSLAEVRDRVEVPITILGGARTAQHLVEGAISGASALAAANMWHFYENVDLDVRQALIGAGIAVRRP